jgi:uncharacterized DUF497 family protein
MDFESFEWDEKKAESNYRKHRIDFEEATQVFSDPLSIEWLDDRTDYGEDRFIVLGKVQGRVLFVSYTIRGETIRLIHARRASKREQERSHGHPHRADMMLGRHSRSPSADRAPTGAAAPSFH